MIQPFRFRLADNALVHEGVACLRFPWDQPIADFLLRVRAVQPLQGPLWAYDPPFRALNTVLALDAFMVHGFLEYGQGEDKTRQAMLLGTAPQGVPAKMELVARTWVRWYVQDTFTKELEARAVQDAYQRLWDEVARPVRVWGEELAVPQLLRPAAIHELAFAAIPSLIATRLAGQRSTILGNPVTWQLAQQKGRNRLVVVSQPVLSTPPKETRGPRTGSFAYVLDFAVQTSPGDDTPYIDLGIHCRRYLEEPAAVLGERATTAMVRTGQPWIVDWPARAPVYVPVEIHGERAEKCHWVDSVALLLQEIQARPLEPAGALLRNPRAYWEGNAYGDRYLILYREGLRPDHPLETGFSIEELYAVWREVSRLTSDLLRPVATMPRDMRTYRAGAPPAMLTPWELLERKRAATYTSGRRVLVPFPPGGKQELVREAFARVAGPKLVRLLVLHRTADTAQHVRETLDPLVEGVSNVRVEYVRVPDELTRPVVAANGDLDDYDREGLKRSERREQGRKAWQCLRPLLVDRETEWKRFLHPLRRDDHVHLVLVEVPYPPSRAGGSAGPRSSPQRSIRGACVALGMGSQLLTALTDWDTSEKARKEGLGRVHNALADLLVRQTGVYWGDIQDVYALAGLPPDVRQNLVVIGLFRRRSYRQGLNYVLAVRILPDNRVEMLLPGRTWETYHQAALTLGLVCRRTSRKGSAVNLPDQEIMRFVEKVCLDRAGPTAVFMVAQQLRRCWPTLKNPNLCSGVLPFPREEGEELRLTLDKQPELRVIRLRDSQQDEIPLAVRVDAGSSPEVFDAVGVCEAGGASGLPVYFSMGRMPSTTRYQNRKHAKAEWGGATAFKHQRALEIVPFFLPAGDDPRAWARLAHFLRFSPGWGGGNLKVPLPIHLADRALDDVDMLIGMGDTENVGEDWE